MTKEETAKRLEFADALERVATQAESVPCFGWDYPRAYVAHECRRWARGYRRSGAFTKGGDE